MAQNTTLVSDEDVIELSEHVSTRVAESVQAVSPKESVTSLPPAAQPPLEQPEIPSSSPEDDTIYPSGWKLRLAFTSLCIVSLLYGLNLAIVAATIPSLTDYLRSVDDIGWYSSAYSLMAASFTISIGKLYSQMPPKTIYLVCITIFEVGSLLCTVAQNSPMFIFGRAVAGIGAAGVGSGSYVMLSHLFPPSKRPVWITVMGSALMIGLVSAPLLGGVLIGWIGWRGCFGVNVPLGVVAIALVGFGCPNTTPNRDNEQSWRSQLKRFDWLSVFLMVPAFTCLLLALQWGGTRYNWSDFRIVLPLVLFAVLFSAFAYRQYLLQDEATVPPRILKMRSVLAACWFSSCVESSLTITEYYMSIYFQGVKGFTASQSGVRMIPLLICITIGSLTGGLGVKWTGYYNPFMIGTTMLAPVASGLLTTITLDESIVKTLCLLGFLGFAVGIGLQAPAMALQTTLNKQDLPIATAILVFSTTLTSSVWIVVSASLFTHRLTDELAASSPSVNATQIVQGGLSDIRNIVGSDRLGSILLGYDSAVTQTLYMPVALTAATIIGSTLIEWRSVKKKVT